MGDGEEMRRGGVWSGVEGRDCGEGGVMIMGVEVAIGMDVDMFPRSDYQAPHVCMAEHES